MTRGEKIQFYISGFVKFLIGTLVVVSAVRQDFFLATISLFVLFLTFLPAIANRSFKIHLPTEIDLIITVLLYLHYGLGEYSRFYDRIWWWDIFLHWGNSLLLGMAGFLMAYALFLTSKVKGKPIFISLFAVSFSVLIGVIWEIFEFGMDSFFGLNMQKSGLVDTMTDLIVDVSGALLIGTAGFFYIKYMKKPDFIHAILEKFSRMRI